MADYISRDKAAKVLCMACGNAACDPFECSFYKKMEDIPAADVVEEENVLKFYYVRSIDDYWIGMRLDNFYYAQYDNIHHRFIWGFSRYLPWGEHVEKPDTLWKQYDYPSEPEVIPFNEWLQGFIKKHILPAADVLPVVMCRDCKHFKPYPGDCADGGIEGVCKRHNSIGVLVMDEDFCSDAERI